MREEEFDEIADDDAPIFWWHLETGLQSLTGFFEEQGLKTRRLETRRICVTCGKIAAQGLELDPETPEDVHCGECLSYLHRVLRLSGNLEADPKPASLDYDRSLSSYFRLSGVLWYAAMARRYGVGPASRVLMDLAAAAIVKRFFREEQNADQYAVYHWARAAIAASKRCVIRQVTTDAIATIHVTDVDRPLGRPPRALRRPFFVEIGDSAESRLVGNTLFLGWYCVDDTVVVMGLDPPCRVRIARWRPNWDQPFESLVAQLDESKGTEQSWARSAVRFLLLLALYEENVQLSPLRLGERPVKVSTLPGGQKGDDGFAWARFAVLDPHWYLRPGADANEEIPAGRLRQASFFDVPISYWAPKEYGFANLACDCRQLQAVLPRCRKTSPKPEDLDTAAEALALLARAEWALPRLLGDGGEQKSEVIDGVAWTLDACQSVIKKGNNAAPGIANVLRRFRTKDREEGSHSGPSRAQHGLPPGEASTGLADEFVRLEHELKEANRKAKELERIVRAQEAELTRLQTMPTAADQPQALDRDRLCSKLEKLKALIDERNAERRDLRERLAEAQRMREATVPRSSSPQSTADEDESFEVPSTRPSRGVHLPRFARFAQAAFDDLPQTIGAAALRALADLGSGDAGAWRGVKQAKDMPRRVLMARIGIHHRLLFRYDDAGLEVLDLVSREGLDLALKRLRGQPPE